MSEVYKFKTMSEVETLEEPTEATTLLAVDGAAVKQIPASKLSGGGTGGGGFIVTGTLDVSTYAITADKTYGEITMAVESGCVPVLLLPVHEQIVFLPLILVDDLGALHFTVTQSAVQLEVSCTPENVWGIVAGD